MVTTEGRGSGEERGAQRRSEHFLHGGNSVRLLEKKLRPAPPTLRGLQTQDSQTLSTDPVSRTNHEEMMHIRG